MATRVISLTEQGKLFGREDPIPELPVYIPTPNLWSILSAHSVADALNDPGIRRNVLINFGGRGGHIDPDRNVNPAYKLSGMHFECTEKTRFEKLDGGRIGGLYYDFILIDTHTGGQIPVITDVHMSIHFNPTMSNQSHLIFNSAGQRITLLMYFAIEERLTLFNAFREIKLEYGLDHVEQTIPSMFDQIIEFLTRTIHVENIHELDPIIAAFYDLLICISNSLNNIYENIQGPRMGLEGAPVDRYPSYGLVGGTHNENYRLYMKYKTKYLNLKKELQ